MLDAFNPELPVDVTPAELDGDLSKAIKPGGPAHAGMTAREVQHGQAAARARITKLQDGLARDLSGNFRAWSDGLALAEGAESPEFADRLHGIMERDSRSSIREAYRQAWMAGREAAGNFKPISADEAAQLEKMYRAQQNYWINLLADRRQGTGVMAYEQRIGMYRRALMQAFWAALVLADLSRDVYWAWVLGATKERCGDCIKLSHGGRWGLGIYSAGELARLGVWPGSGKTECLTECGCRLERCKRPAAEPRWPELTAADLHGPKGSSFHGQGRTHREHLHERVKRHSWNHQGKRLHKSLVNLFKSLLFQFHAGSIRPTKAMAETYAADGNCSTNDVRRADQPSSHWETTPPPLSRSDAVHAAAALNQETLNKTVAVVSASTLGRLLKSVNVHQPHHYEQVAGHLTREPGKREPPPEFVRTKAFKEWFGDWESSYPAVITAEPDPDVSQIVDDISGEPLIDQGRADDYWSSPHEMAARAFESFVHDKIDEQGHQSQYLVHSVTNNHYLPDKPYPEGEERTAINAAAQQLVDVIRSEAVLTAPPPAPLQKSVVHVVSAGTLGLLLKALNKGDHGPLWGSKRDGGTGRTYRWPARCSVRFSTTNRQTTYGSLNPYYCRDALRSARFPREEN